MGWDYKVNKPRPDDPLHYEMFVQRWLFSCITDLITLAVDLILMLICNGCKCNSVAKSIMYIEMVFLGLKSKYVSSKKTKLLRW